MYIKAYKTIRDEQGNAATELRDYTEIVKLSFAPSADLTGASLPVNEFRADIHTTDDIDIGAYAELYDDTDALWASYWVTHAEHIADDTLRIRACSAVALLERATLPATRYEDRDVRAVLDQVLGEVVSVPYTLDSAFDGMTISGFCPEQTPRARLLWVCFAIGAYVRAYFNQRLEILPVESDTVAIPKANTYWRPALNHRDWVTEVRVRAYSFAAGDPGPADRFVTSATGVNYVMTTQDFTLKNPDAPAIAPRNVVSVNGVMLVNPDNVSDVLARLGRWAFCRAEADVDVIDNGDILPGRKVAAHIDDATMVTGWVDRAAFSFGLQAKAALHLTGVAALESAELTLRYIWEGVQVHRAVYRFPVGYEYAVQNPWTDCAMNAHRYVFRPVNAAAAGVMPEGDVTRDEPCEPALDLYEGVLHIISADRLTDGEGTVKIA